MAAINTYAVITEADIPKLIAFHEHHFPGQPVPHIEPHTSASPADQDGYGPAEEDLGFYSDGTRRTLTDDQIAMFRHSEIQRILADRRQQKAMDEEQQEREARARRREERQQREAVKDSRAKPGRQNEDAQISYDDTVKQDNTNEEKKFLWPTLG